MKFATVLVSGQHRPAIVSGEEIIDLVAARTVNPAAKLLPQDMIGIITGGRSAFEIARDIELDANRNSGIYRNARALVRLNDVQLAAPLPVPRLILAIGANYGEHLKEMNTPRPATPMAFHKSISSVVGSGGDIVLPPNNSGMVDYEGEFTIVMGRTCHNVSEDKALDYVFGYTIANDVSARDWVAPAFQAQGMINTIVAWEHNILGKLFPTFCPMGPFIVTSDEIGDPHDLHIETRLNGQVMQSSNTSDLIFNVREIIAYYSKFMTFEPGDTILTGSPSGVGFGRKPPVFMKANDIVEVSVEKVGTLKNTIRAAAKSPTGT